MSRSGVEAKPSWRSVPLSVREAVAEVLGARVVRAMRVYGGYGPTPTFRLRLSDGRAAFLKAIGGAPTAFMVGSHQREERIYRELQPYIAGWAPAFFGAFERDGWLVMLLEDLGPKSAPPWKPAVIRGVSRAFGAFHRETLGVPLPEFLPRPRVQLATPDHLWQALDMTGQESLAALAGDAKSDALRWLESALPQLAAAAAAIADAGRPYSLIHRDVRSDNLRWRAGRLCLLDWPHAGVGPAEYDLAEFAQSVETEGGPPAEQVAGWYREQFPMREDALDASVAALAGFFAAVCWRPDIPGLPRLRSFQRAQLAVTLAWAARRLRLPVPTWLRSIAPSP